MSPNPLASWQADRTAVKTIGTGLHVASVSEARVSLHLDA